MIHLDITTICLAIAIGLLLVGLAWAVVTFVLLPAGGGGPVEPNGPEGDDEEEGEPEDPDIAGYAPWRQPLATDPPVSPTDAWVTTRETPIVLTAADFQHPRPARHRYDLLEAPTVVLHTDTVLAAAAADPTQPRWLNPHWRTLSSDLPVAQLDIDPRESGAIFAGNRNQPRSHRAGRR